MNYREVLPNEIIEAGDQYEAANGRWLPTTRAGEIHGGGQKLRRPIDPLREVKARYGFVSAASVPGPAVRAGRHVAVTLTSTERPSDTVLAQLAGGRRPEDIAPVEVMGPGVPLGPPKPMPFVGETLVREWVVGREPPFAREVVAPALVLGLTEVGRG